MVISVPSHRYHKALNRLVLGDDYELVNLVKDAPYRLFPGKKHRQYFHDRATNFWLGILLGPKAFLAGELHDWLDREFIEDRETGQLVPREKWRKKRKRRR
ncbi:hypothetical protein [Thermococcus sp.]|uniref:hypothetical protein n=1 Tax=Thermococcus sp. TaxID=35749 RepID=UPI002605C953|nr:hypothetical protein [Thermococcus sp.]